MAEMMLNPKGITKKIPPLSKYFLTLLLHQKSNISSPVNVETAKERIMLSNAPMAAKTLNPNIIPSALAIVIMLVP